MPVRTLLRLLATCCVLALVGTAAVWGVVLLLRASDGELLPAERCTALLDGVHQPLSHEQAENAALLAGRALGRGMPARAVTIAIATAMQESSLRNLEHGDRDSLGLFQQRPSQGWGSPEEVLDPVHATEAFYDALEKVPGYRDMAVTEAAQAVQRSAFPDAYAQHEQLARAWASALTGHSPGAVTCVDHEPVVGDLPAFLERVERDLGAVARVEEGLVVLDATALTHGAEGAGRVAWGLAQWAVAVSPVQGVAEVHVADRRWTAGDAWRAAGASLPEGIVHVRLVTEP